MSEKENLDVGKIVGLIMETPQMIEQISALAKGSDTKPSESEPVSETPEVQSVSADTYEPRRDGRNERARLLGALKPYVSGERAKAIDSMITIADILDVMRSR